MDLMEIRHVRISEKVKLQLTLAGNLEYLASNKNEFASPGPPVQDSFLGFKGLTGEQKKKKGKERKKKTANWPCRI